MTASSSEENILKRATRAQYLQSLENQPVEWGAGLTLEQFVQRETRLGETQQGKCLQCWVLVPSSDPDTPDFYCSVETFRRPLLLLTKPGTPVRRGITYSIASVFTPPHHRRKGHARMMMALLHDQLRRKDGYGSNAPLSLQETLSGPSGTSTHLFNDAETSFLYSDVGEFYAKCGNPGWHIQGRTTVEYQIASIPPTPREPESSTRSGSSPQPISRAQFETLAKAHSTFLQIELARQAEPSVIVEPTGSTYEWMTTRSTAGFQLGGVECASDPWGFEMGSSDDPESWSFIVFAFDAAPKKRIVNLLRVRCARKEDYPRLLSKVVEHVRASWGEQGKIIGWNVDESWITEAEKKRLKGATFERDEHLAAMAVYAKGFENQSIRWLKNEQYSWC
ncbi:BQ2448_5900 [Microbotryum intermedium]|uniref:BQ2448_5900 protein n=1 Tax=Microbotryum intermedium TaxID=269621 RepID=A0A238F5Y2_9BASI|nr:BQ2448_5900 [Microbotryum intermedium]